MKPGDCFSRSGLSKQAEAEHQPWPVGGATSQALGPGPGAPSVVGGRGGGYLAWEPPLGFLGVEPLVLRAPVGRCEGELAPSLTLTLWVPKSSTV